MTFMNASEVVPKHSTYLLDKKKRLDFMVNSDYIE